VADLRDFTYLKAVRRVGHRQPILYGASDPTGPWYRLSKRETAFVVSRHTDILTDIATEPPNEAVQ
jgi:hypothetical protein